MGPRLRAVKSPRKLNELSVLVLKLIHFSKANEGQLTLPTEMKHSYTKIQTLKRRRWQHTHYSLTAAPERQLLGFTVGSWVVNSLDPGIWKSNLTGEGARKEKATVNEGPWGRKMKWPGHTYFNSVPTNLFLSYEGRR